MAQRSEDWKTSARNLLKIIQDLDLREMAETVAESSAASELHKTLFGQYVSEMRQAREEAEQWWENLIRTEAEQTGDRDEAIRNVEERRPIGPACHPKVISTVRKFWLKCVALNQQPGTLPKVAPEALVLGWLMKGEHEEVAEFVAAFPYWPLGLDREGNWV